MGKAKKKNPVRNLFSAADIKFAKAKAAFEGKNARTENRKAYEKIGRVFETEGLEARDRPWPSAMSAVLGSRAQSVFSTKQPLPQNYHAAPAEVDDDLMVLHPAASFDGAKVSQKAVMTITHPSQSAVLEHARNDVLVRSRQKIKARPLGSLRALDRSITRLSHDATS